MRTLPVAYILWFFLGVLGVHRFYCNRIGTGVLWLLTGGVFGIGWLVDVFLVPDMVRQANRELLASGRQPSLRYGDAPQSSPPPHSEPPAHRAQPQAAVAAGHRVIYCTHCGGAMQVPINDVGEHFACPACRNVVIVPS